MINTRDDLDALVGTAAHTEFMTMLEGTLWRLERDDTAKTWRAVEDNSTIERFGFTRNDFPDAIYPTIPYYNKINLKNNEIKNRTLKYKSDILDIQTSWISASIVDGADEINKKQQIQLDLNNLKAEYDTDILIIKNKYQN